MILQVNLREKYCTLVLAKRNEWTLQMREDIFVKALDHFQ